MDNNLSIIMDDYYMMEENPLHQDNSTQTGDRSNIKRIKYNNSKLYDYCFSWKWMFFYHDTFIDYKNHRNISSETKLICCSFYPQLCEFLVPTVCFSQYVECCCFTFLPFV